MSNETVLQVSTSCCYSLSENAGLQTISDKQRRFINVQMEQIFCMLRFIQTNKVKRWVKNERRLLLDESWPRCFELMSSTACCRAGRLSGGRCRKSGGRRALARLPSVSQDVQRFDSGWLHGAVVATTAGHLAYRCSVRPLERLIWSGNTSSTVRSLTDWFLDKISRKFHSETKIITTTIF